METRRVRLEEPVLRWCAREGFPLEGGVKVLCAVSGGGDSMAMLHLLWQLSLKGGVEVSAAVYDHGLRPESPEESRFVAEWCRSRRIPCVQGRGDVQEAARQQGRSIEDAARELRYAFLEESRRALGADYIATAHHAEDNGETLLLHLLRGSGLNGLGGIPPRRGRVIRPLLELTRSQLETYLSDWQIPFCRDESNLSTDYTRNYLRHQIMPLLREKNPNLTQTLSRTAQSLRRDGAYLDSRAQSLADALRPIGQGWGVPVCLLREQPRALTMRLIQIMAERIKQEAVLPQLQRQKLLELAERPQGDGRLSLAAGLEGRREYDLLVIAPKREPDLTFPPTVLGQQELTYLPETGWQLRCRREPVWSGELSREGLLLRAESYPILRQRQPGDRIKLPGQPTKSLKQLFNQRKIPPHRRGQYPVLEQQGELCGLLGIGAAESWLPKEGEPVWHIQVISKEEKE